MTVTVYKSSDTSAPVLTGQVGTLITVLDACLVNGYGSKSAAGWTKPFSGTNTAVYLGSAGHYLDLDDSGAGAGGAQEATVRGYESMTAVATGTNPFPTVAQKASPGLFIRKSVAASATARAWIVIADGTTFYLFILSGDTANVYQSFGFGRFYSMTSSDTYRSILLGHNVTGVSATGFDTASWSATISGLSGVYVPRIRAATGTSINASVYGVGTSLFSSPVNGPNPGDGLIYLSRLFVGDAIASSGLRGYLRGVYQIITAVGLNDGDTFTGSGDFAGRTFTVLKTTAGSGYLALETSAWDTSS